MPISFISRLMKGAFERAAEQPCSSASHVTRPVQQVRFIRGGRSWYGEQASKR